MAEKKYPEYIMEMVRQNLYLEANDTSKDSLIDKMETHEVFDRVAIWTGFINYGSTIRGWVRDIYNVELCPKRFQKRGDK